jgi:hypothetical protein
VGWDGKNVRITDKGSAASGGPLAEDAGKRAFAEGLRLLWEGRSEAAAQQFQQAAARGYSDAREFYEWLCDGGLDGKGIVRLQWRDMPPDATVTLDGVPLTPDHILVRVKAGEHRLRVEQAGMIVTDQMVQVGTTRAHVIRIGMEE